MRESMGGILPEDVRWRTDKKGFAAPYVSWFTRKDTLDGIRELLLDEKTEARGILKRAGVERSIDAPPSVGFAILHAMSKNKLRIWDIETSKEMIGFDPEDGAGEEWTSPPDGPRSFM